MTIDEELTQLEDGIRRLKIEYDIFLNTGSNRPPNDSQWRVERLIKKLADSPQMNFAQRFRYNGLTSRYALFSDLWRQRVRTKEEGPRRNPLHQETEDKNLSFRTKWNNPSEEPEKVDKLFSALLEAKKKLGEDTQNLAADSFQKYVVQKTAQLKRDFKCEQVEYCVEIENGQVRLKAKGL
ncbi:MAG: hypothetical protein A3F68_10595 [Acidobacteria bacterium RIFCSPLOWO2_12_FULL_54_10]|nr:MAG: hypothetical protein A3F68_10595 [Acidobacteria bacterium RIFCSPLOWO2_12_FULL_54_10]